MPSFDIVSEVDMHEVCNAIDQANREIGNRYDFKGTNAEVLQSDTQVTLKAENEFQIKQMLTIVYNKFVKRNIDIASIKENEVQYQGQKAQLILDVMQGIDSDTARKIVKLIKEKKLKVQAAVQGEQVRVTGKKRDDLQAVIAMLREQTLAVPLQYNNFRD